MDDQLREAMRKETVINWRQWMALSDHANW
jgi:hypothetical protein